MSCRHDLANGTCRECYPSTGKIKPDQPGNSLDGPGAVPAKPKPKRLKRCPQCGSVEIYWTELSLASQTFQQDSNGIDPEGWMSHGDIMGLSGECRKCKHKWKSRTNQVTGLPGYP